MAKSNRSFTRFSAPCTFATVDRICSTISRNPYNFKAGHTMTAARLVQLFGWLLPLTTINTTSISIKDGLNLVSLQAKANAVLAERGVRLKSQDYYQYFTVQDIPSVTKEIAVYQSVAQYKDKAGKVLRQGLSVGRNKWSLLRSAEKERPALRIANHPF